MTQKKSPREGQTSPRPPRHENLPMKGSTSVVDVKPKPQDFLTLQPDRQPVSSIDQNPKLKKIHSTVLSDSESAFNKTFIKMNEEAITPFK